MTPRLLLRNAALGALAAAAADAGDADFAPLIGATVLLGQTWPSQSPAPGAGPLPNQLLLYAWDEKSDSVSGKTTEPQFETTLTVVIEARTEVTAAAATAVLPAQPESGAIAAAIDGALDALTYAVKKAICQGIGVAASALNGGRPVVEDIKSVTIEAKYAETGQRIAGNCAVAVDLVYGEHFEPLIAEALDEIAVLVLPEAGGVANGGNAGNGTIGLVTVGLGAEAGAYAVHLTSPTEFAVTMPDSSAAGTGTVGAAFAGGGIGFTIAAGTVPFAAGDGFTVTVQVAAENLITF